MPRQPKPFLNRGWYCTNAGGSRVRLCPESAGYAEAERLLAEHLASLTPPEPAPQVSGLTHQQFFKLFMAHARTYYRLPGGEPSGEVESYELSFRELLALHGPEPVAAFTKRDLKGVRQAMIDGGLSRGVINQRVGRLVRAYKWGAEEELVPDAVAAALLLVSPLKPGRSPAREREPIRPVDVALVEATLPHLSPPVRAMARFQLATGCRPGECCMLSVGDIDTSAELWRADLTRKHKMAYRRKPRVILIGPRGREILLPWIDGVGDPARAVWRPVNHGGRWLPSYGTHYKTHVYANNIARACRRLGLAHWHPNQLRHTYATLVREAFGIEAAAGVLGHANLNTSLIYAERSLKLAGEVAKELG